MTMFAGSDLRSFIIVRGARSADGPKFRCAEPLSRANLVEIFVRHSRRCGSCTRPSAKETADWAQQHPESDGVSHDRCGASSDTRGQPLRVVLNSTCRRRSSSSAVRGSQVAIQLGQLGVDAKFADPIQRFSVPVDARDRIGRHVSFTSFDTGPTRDASQIWSDLRRHGVQTSGR
jgi:hypothetical protein